MNCWQRCEFMFIIVWSSLRALFRFHNIMSVVLDIDYTIIERITTRIFFFLFYLKLHTHTNTHTYKYTHITHNIKSSNANLFNLSHCPTRSLLGFFIHVSLINCFWKKLSTIDRPCSILGTKWILANSDKFTIYTFANAICIYCITLGYLFEGYEQYCLRPFLHSFQCVSIKGGIKWIKSNIRRWK